MNPSAIFARAVLALITTLLLVLLDDVAAENYIYYGYLLRGLVLSMIAIHCIVVVLSFKALVDYIESEDDQTDIAC